MRLRDKVAVVVGGASGMGEAVALLFSQEGALVVIADIDHDKATGVQSRIQALGHTAKAMQVDVTNEQEVNELVDAVMTEFKRIDILINCVGVSRSKAATEMTLEEWRSAVDINLTGVFLCCREVGKTMIRRRKGKIVNFGSTAGLSGAPSLAHYTAAKHGVVGLTKALAVEWGKYGINVNCICPGATLTPMLLGFGSEFRAERTRRIPLGRLGEPIDQANAALFLASTESDYVSGSVICVDGGVYAMAAGTSEAALQGGT